MCVDGNSEQTRLEIQGHWSERDGEWHLIPNKMLVVALVSARKSLVRVHRKWLLRSIAGCTLSQVLLSAAYLESNAFTNSINNNFLSPVGNPGQLIQYESLQDSADSFIWIKWNFNHVFAWDFCFNFCITLSH